MKLRTQLTLLYAGPFFVSGTLLLSIPFFGTKVSQPADAPPGTAPTTEVLGPPVAESAVALAVLAVVSLGLGWWIAGRFLRPIRTIIATARDISASNLHRRLGRTGRADEFGDLAATLDDLFERLDASFAAQRHFVANASHELRTPLTAERTVLQVALADPDATVDTLRDACRDVLRLGESQERLIDALLTLATSEQELRRRSAFDLAGVAGAAVAAAGTEAENRGVRLESALDAAPVHGDPDLVASLVSNLVENGLRHNVPGGRVEVSTSTFDGRARIVVGNTGPVIAPDAVPALFRPFQRLGPPRLGGDDGGHGLGLAIVRAIAQAHRATLDAHARPDGGLRVEIAFPVGTGDAAHPADVQG